MDSYALMEGTPKTPALIDEKNAEQYLLFLTNLGIEHPTMRRMKSGRNSRVWKVENSRGQWILKDYYRHPGDNRDRLATEFRFLRFLWEKGLRNIPEPLKCNPVENHALYSFLSGKPVVRISASHVDQAVDFIVRLNQLRTIPAAQKLPVASEACFSLREHLVRLKERLGSLEKGIISFGGHQQARELVKEAMIPAFKKIQATIQSAYSSITDQTLEHTERILSPSDFGFHNILQAEGTLQFLDFEYAGWDDPAKLICDFACQPERPISQAQAQQFGEKISESLDLPSAMARAKVLLPLHRLKWCCIFLNEFQKKDRERREHSGRDSSRLLSLQVEKARNYFNQHLEEI